MASDLGGAEKPLDWVALLRKELTPGGPATMMQRPGRIRPRHRIAVMLQEAGWRVRDIAAALGYSEPRVSIILNSHHPSLMAVRAHFASEIADRAKDLNARFMLYGHEMLDILVKHAKNWEGRPELSRLAARDILHMAGFTPVKRQITLEGKLPEAEIQRALGKIEEANEVVLKSTEWRVKEPA